MAKITIMSAEHEAGFFEGVRGQGIALLSAEELERGMLVTATGEYANATDETKPPIGYVGMATGEYRKVIANQTFRPVRDALVYVAERKAVGTKVFLSNVDGEFADVAGTVETQVGVYVRDSEANATDSDVVLITI